MILGKHFSRTVRISKESADSEPKLSQTVPTQKDDDASFATDSNQTDGCSAAPDKEEPPPLPQINSFNDLQQKADDEQNPIGTASVTN